MQVLGIHFDKPFLRVSMIKKSRRGAEILCLKSTSLSKPDDVKQLYKPSFKGKIASCLPARNILIRSFEVQGGDHRHLKDVITFQSEATSYFEPSDVLSVPYFLKKGTKKSEILLFTVSRGALQEHLLELKKWEIDPDFVSAPPLALVHYVQWKIPSLTDAFLIDLGSSEWTCVWMEKGQLKKSHTLPRGIETLLSALWEDRKKILFQNEVKAFAKQIDLLQLKPNLNPHLSSHLNQMRQDLAKIIFSFHQISGSRPLLFTGRVDAFTHMREFLVQSFKESICGECNRAIPLEEQKHAIAIGLGLEQSNDSLQLRREEFFPSKNWKRVGFYFLCLTIASLFTSAAMIHMGNRAILSRKSAMISSLQDLLDNWDPSLKQTIFSMNGNEEEILNRWSQLVSYHSKEYPFILQAPKVSEVLSWLSNHPLLKALKKENDPIEILSFKYQILTQPKIEALQDPYQAKVEIEFKTKSPLNARKFHEALLQGDEKVDPLEIDWEDFSDFYRVAFNLKNRSSYVP